LLLSATLLGVAAPSPNRGVVILFGGKQIRLPSPARLIDGNVYAPIEFLKTLGIKYSLGKTSEGEDKQLTISPLHEKAFKSAVSSIENRDMICVTEIAPKLGLATSWNEGSSTLTIHAEVEKIRFDGAELHVYTSLPTTAQILSTDWAKKANKLILDVANAQPGNPRIIVENSTSAAINTGTQGNGEIVRIVLDLPASAEYKLTSPPKSAEIVVAVTKLPPPHTEHPIAANPPVAPPTPTFGPISITSLDYKNENSHHTQIYIYASGPAKYTTSVSPNMELIIDIPQATLPGSMLGMGIKHSLVREFRVEQSDGLAKAIVHFTRPTAYNIKWDEESSRFVIDLDLPKGAGGLLSQKTIVIDPGHGGTYTGATGLSGKFEKDYNFQIATQLKELLESAGANVFMTRRGDESLDPDVKIDLEKRVHLAIEKSADFFISIHCNSCPVPGARSGTETYYHDKDINSQALARSVHSHVVKLTGLPDCNVRPDVSISPIGLSVLRNSATAGLPAMLIEVGFINCKTDEACIGNPDFQKRVAEGIVHGLKSYVEGGDK